jgi:cyclase
MFNTVELDGDITVLLGDDQQSNSVLLTKEESLIIVDTLCGERDVARLKEIVCCQGAPLRYIVNTHWHSDHIGGNNELKSMFPESSIIAHESYLDTISAEESIITTHPKSSPDSYIPPQILVNDSYEIIPDLQMMYAGGHSKDSCILHIPGKSLVICGDVVVSAGVNAGVSIPYFYWGNPYDLVKALEKIRELDPHILIPGHGWIVKSDIIDKHILYLQRLLAAYQEFCGGGGGLISDNCLPENLELEKIVDCAKGVHWIFRRMHNYNLLCLEKLAKVRELL